MVLGLYFSVCDNLDLSEALDTVARLGYQCIEISGHTGGRFPVGGLLNGEGRLLRAAAQQAGIRISAINMSADGQLVLGPHHSDTDGIHAGSAEEKIRYGTEQMLVAAQVAHELEVPVVTGFTGCEDYSRWFPWPDPDAWARMEPVFVERWDPILARFDALGVRFGMECHPRQIVYNTETALRSIELVGSHQSWAFNLDPANLMLAGVDPVVFAARLAGRIVNVHAKDGEVVSQNSALSGLLANGPWERRDRGFRFRVAGWGDVPWRKMITELVLGGYDGPLVVEHEDPTMGRMEGVRQAASFLLPLLIREPFPGRWW